jgi:hypothetical protein
LYEYPLLGNDSELINNKKAGKPLSKRGGPNALYEIHVVNVTDPYDRIPGFLARSRYFFFQVAPELYS